MSEANNSTVRRLVDEVLNGGRLEVVDELYAPELAGGTLANRTYIHQLPQTPPRLARLIEDLYGPAARQARSGDRK